MFGSLLSLERSNRKAVGSRRPPTILRSLLWPDQPHIVPSEKTLAWQLGACSAATSMTSLSTLIMAHKHARTHAHAFPFNLVCVRAAVRHPKWSIENLGSDVLRCRWVLEIGSASGASAPCCAERNAWPVPLLGPTMINKETLHRRRLGQAFVPGFNFLLPFNLLSASKWALFLNPADCRRVCRRLSHFIFADVKTSSVGRGEFLPAASGSQQRV